mgnify:CR=1 FL=1
MVVAIGKGINFFRNMRGITQEYLGMQIGFPEKSADVRLARYETGAKTPKTDLTVALADTLDAYVCPKRMPHSFTQCCMLGDTLPPCSKQTRSRRKNIDRWHYHYPEFDTTQRRAKVSSQKLSDCSLRF